MNKSPIAIPAAMFLAGSTSGNEIRAEKKLLLCR